MNEKRYYQDVEGVKELTDPVNVNEHLQDANNRWEILQLTQKDFSEQTNPIDPATCCLKCGKPIKDHERLNVADVVKEGEKSVYLTGEQCKNKPFKPEYQIVRKIVYIMGLIKPNWADSDAQAQKAAAQPAAGQGGTLGDVSTFNLTGINFNGGKFKWLVNNDKALKSLNIQYETQNGILTVYSTDAAVVKKVKAWVEWVQAPDKRGNY